MNSYEDGRSAASAKIWRTLQIMHDKYPMTGKPDKDAAFKNGWYDVCFEVINKLGFTRVP